MDGITKEEDVRRAALGNMVKLGKLTPEEAVAYAQKLGLLPSSEGPSAAGHSNGGNQVYNFSVYKWKDQKLSESRTGKTVQRVILQFDFQLQTVSCIQHGVRTKKVEFTEITGYQSEDGLRLTIQLSSQSDYELDADTLEEKTTMVRLLSTIAQRQDGITTISSPFVIESPTQAQAQGHLKSPLTQRRKRERKAAQMGRAKEGAMPQQPLQLYSSSAPIKEGLVEKKGQATGWFFWPRRWVRVFQGELLYYKPDDLENALNIIPLSAGETTPGKVDTNKFTITLARKGKVFSFRVISEPDTAQKERDEWHEAIQLACRPMPVYSSLLMQEKNPAELLDMIKEELGSLEETVSAALREKTVLHNHISAITTLVSALETCYEDQTEVSDEIPSGDPSHGSEDTSSNEQHLTTIGVDAQAKAEYEERGMNGDTTTTAVPLVNKQDMQLMPQRLSQDTSNSDKGRESSELHEHKSIKWSPVATDTHDSFHGPPAPPPPPPKLHSALGLLQSTASRKRKVFHWTLPRMEYLVASGWMEWSQEPLPAQLDLQRMEQLFSVETKDGRRPPTAKKPARVHLVEHARAWNIEIFLRSFPLPTINLGEVLNQQLNCISEDSLLKIEHIVSLKRLQPSEEEKELCRRYKGDMCNLQPADTFMVELCEVPMLSTRLDLLFLAREFPSNLEGLDPVLDLAWRACDELNRCSTFVEVLQCIMAMGNFINEGTKQGKALGFKLETLPKLIDFRGKDKVTLLHYLIQELNRERPELLDFPQQMESVERASEISVTSIVAEVEGLHKELDKMERTVTKIVKHPMMSKSSTVELQRDVKDFLSQYRCKVRAMTKKGEEMQTLFRLLLVKFGEPASTQSEDLFGCWVSKFISQFKRVTEELFPPDPPQVSSRHNSRRQGVLHGMKGTSPISRIHGDELDQVPLSMGDSSCSTDDMEP